MKKRLTIVTTVFIFAFAAIANKIVSERNVQHLGDTFSEIYNDRLLAESYIYQLTELFYKKKIILLEHEKVNYDSAYKKQMQTQTYEIACIADKYALTKLTNGERQIFENLEDNIRLLKVAESRLNDGETKELKEICEGSFWQLKLLSSIQIVEGKLLKDDGKKVLSSSYLAAQLEWTALIIIPVVCIFILRKRRHFEGTSPRHQLN